MIHQKKHFKTKVNLKKRNKIYIIIIYNMNSLEKIYKYPKNKPNGIKNLNKKRLHSSNRLLLDILIDKLIEINNNINILEIGSFTGIFANYISKKINIKSKIICLGDKWDKKSFEQFIINIWNLRNKILPIKTNNLLKSIIDIYNKNIKLDLIYIYVDELKNYEEIYNIITIILTLFPNVVISGSGYLTNKKVFNVIENLKIYILQKNIYTYKNIFVFNNEKKLLDINYFNKVNYNPNYNNKILLLIHDNYKIIKEDKYKKLFNHEFIFYYYLTKENFNGIYLNSLIDYVYKNYDLNNIIFYNINNNYNSELLEKYFFSSYDNILYLDNFNSEYSKSFMISYDLFKINGGFDNIFEEKKLITIFLNKINIKFNSIYKPLFNIFENNKNNKNNDLIINNSNLYNNSYNEELVNISNYNHINYKIKDLKFIENMLFVTFSELDFNYNYNSSNLLKPLIYTLFPINKNESNKNKLNNSSINELRKNKALKYNKLFKINNNNNNLYNHVFLIFLNYVSIKNPQILMIQNKKNNDEDIIQTFNLFFKKYNIEDKLIKSHNYDLLVFYKNEYTKNGMNYYFQEINKRLCFFTNV